jgi:cytoskeletal protein CcmA (bactofilin family)
MSLCAAIAVALLVAGQLGMAGIDGTGYTQGAVQRIASVFVNDVKYATGAARIWIDGVPGSEEQLQVGQIVGVLGEVNSDGVTGQADQVFHDHQVIGRVDRLLPDGLELLGQRIAVDPATVLGADIADFALSSLSVGDRVAISGQRRPDGVVVASWIGRADRGQPPTVLGRASAVKPAWGRFQIQGLTVMAGLASLDGLSEVRAGDLIQVTGMFRVGDVLLARSVRSVAAPLSPGGRATLSGFVGSLAVDGTFELDGRRVSLRPGTRMAGGSAADLAAAPEVIVSGFFDGDLLVADSVRMSQAADYCIAGTVEDLDVRAGLVFLGGERINVHRTRLVDFSILAIRRFDLRHVNIGDQVRACGRHTGSGLEAVLLARLPLAPRPFRHPGSRGPAAFMSR